ncbi:hypothetical protein BDV10DRAFT_186465 [Aspergillus recurvatus]
MAGQGAGPGAPDTAPGGDASEYGKERSGWCEWGWNCSYPKLASIVLVRAFKAAVRNPTLILILILILIFTLIFELVSPSTTTPSDRKSAKIRTLPPRPTKPKLRLFTSKPDPVPYNRIVQPLVDPCRANDPDYDGQREARLRAAARKGRRRLLEGWRREMKTYAGSTVSGFSGLPSDAEYYGVRSGWSEVVDMRSEKRIINPLPRCKRDAPYMMDPECVECLNRWDCYLADASPSAYASPNTSPNVRDSGHGPEKKDKDLCGKVLAANCKAPTGTLFDDGTWAFVKAAVKQKNEYGIMQLVGNLIVPRTELAMHHLRGKPAKELKDAMCEVWDHAIPFDEQSARLPHRYAVMLPAMAFKLPCHSQIIQWDSTTTYSVPAV